MSQLIQIRLKDGIPSLLIYPRPEVMLFSAATAEPNTQVLRRFTFPDGVPAQYAWVNGPGVRHHGIIWEQHFWTVDAWRAQLNREEAGGPDHFLPVPQPPATPASINPP